MFRDENAQAAFFLASVSWSTPMISLSFMIRRSTPSSLTSVPDHLPNNTRSPTLRSIGINLPVSSRPPGPTATISPCEGFSWAVSGMMMPPADFASGSIRSTTTQSCSGRNFIGILLRFPQKVWQIWTLVVLSKAVRRGPLLRNAWRSGGIIYRLGHACLDCAGSFSRHLPNERAELLILPRHDPKLLAHLCSRQLDKFRRGFHTEQLVDVERFHK